MKNGYCKILVLLIGMCPVIPGAAQEARPAVIAACGTSSQSIDGYTISFTVGEPVILTAGTNTIFTQGFHQPLIASDYPLVTLNLRGAAKGNYIQLDWTTNTEVNNDWFFIERGANALQFTTIDSVRTKAANGNSTVPLHYTYADLRPLSGANFYRLRQVSRSGLTRYSETVTVNFTGPNWRAAIYPNPVNATLFLQLFSERQTKAAITLHNLAGQQVLRRELNLPAGYSSHTLEMGHMKAGMYILTVRDETTNGTLHVKLVKQ